MWIVHYRAGKRAASLVSRKQYATDIMHHATCMAATSDYQRVGTGSLSVAAPWYSSLGLGRVEIHTASGMFQLFPYMIVCYNPENALRTYAISLFDLTHSKLLRPKKLITPFSFSHFFMSEQVGVRHSCHPAGSLNKTQDPALVESIHAKTLFLPRSFGSAFVVTSCFTLGRRT